jgi:hypothetical protein
MGRDQEGRVDGRKAGASSQEFSNLNLEELGMVEEAATRRGK